jgi:uncharacterized phage-associated protein
MSNVHDIAAALMEQNGPMSAMKLQKLSFYCQAWHLAWYGESLFSEPIEGWIDGPVIRALWSRHAGRHRLSRWHGDASALTKKQTRTVELVSRFYGPIPANELSRLTHFEEPWKLSRTGLGLKQSGNREITLASMQRYYGETPCTLLNSTDPFKMVANLVRQLSDGDWGVNVQRPLSPYVGHAMKMLAPLISNRSITSGVLEKIA